MPNPELAAAAAWLTEVVGYPIDMQWPADPAPDALWEAVVDHIHADATGKWHGNTLDREDTALWLAEEAGRA